MQLWEAAGERRGSKTIGEYGHGRCRSHGCHIGRVWRGLVACSLLLTARCPRAPASRLVLRCRRRRCQRRQKWRANSNIWDRGYFRNETRARHVKVAKSFFPTYHHHPPLYFHNYFVHPVYHHNSPVFAFPTRSPGHSRHRPTNASVREIMIIVQDPNGIRRT